MITSCESIQPALESTHYSETKSYTVKRWSDGCCGCAGYYISFLDGKRITEQVFVSDDVCSFQAVKYVVQYDDKDRFIGCDTLIPITSDTFDIELNNVEEKVFTLTEDLHAERVNNRTLTLDLKNVKGYQIYNKKKFSTFLMPLRLERKMRK